MIGQKGVIPCEYSELGHGKVMWGIVVSHETKTEDCFKASSRTQKQTRTGILSFYDTLKERNSTFYNLFWGENGPRQREEWVKESAPPGAISICKTARAVSYEPGIWVYVGHRNTAVTNPNFAVSTLPSPTAKLDS